jgi:hypothetical protein
MEAVVDVMGKPFVINAHQCRRSAGYGTSSAREIAVEPGRRPDIGSARL